MTVKATLFHPVTDLITPLAGGIKILLGIPLDLWCSTPSRFDLVAEIAEKIGQFRLINSGCKLLRFEEPAFLQCPCLSMFALGDVKDDSVGMELRRGVAINRAGGVMLKLRRDEPSRRLSRLIASDPCLGIPL